MNLLLFKPYKKKKIKCSTFYIACSTLPLTINIDRSLKWFGTFIFVFSIGN